MGKSCLHLLLTVFFAAVLMGKHAYPSVPSIPEGDTAKIAEYDTGFIRDYKRLLTMRFFILYQETKLIYDVEQLGNVVFKPNLVYKAGFAGFYRWFGLGLSYYSPLSIKNNETNGKTKAYDLRINVYSDIFIIEGYAQWMKGMYISNFTDPQDEFYKNPSLRLLSIGASGYYILNYRKFSMRAANLQNEQQLKSAGSFMARLSLSYGNIKTDSGLIPPQLIRDQNLDSVKNLEKGSYYLAGFAPGYGYTLVFLKNFYVNANVFLGIGWSLLSGENNTGKVRSDGFGLQLNPRLAAGYNSGKWFIGGSAVMGIWQFSALSDYTLLFDAPQFRIWVGTRFDLHRHKNKKK